MRKTLLLVFIHGFKGGDDTFGTFPEHLRALISHALPKVDVLAVAYPRFETRGELKECVSRFKEWLENKVIDIEVAHSTPSPTIDPSVHTVLIGHSMGGIVAVETFLLLARERPLPPSSSADTYLSSTTSNPEPPSATAGLMFPHIQGLLAFDTPFLGLNPSMVSHSLESSHKMASSAYGAFNELSRGFGWGAKSESAIPVTTPLALPATAAVDAAAAPKWQSWGKYAMFAGAAGAVAAGGAAALYSQKEKISAGWGWASSHLLFVGDLVKPEHLRKRVQLVEKTCQERGVGCANLYTNLGKGAREGYGVTAAVAPGGRTFCNLPVKAQEEKRIEGVDYDQGMKWVKSINEKAKDETGAHMSMFYPRDNPGFYSLGQTAKEMVAGWVDQGWYMNSEDRPQSTTTAVGEQSSSDGTLLLLEEGVDGEGWEAPTHQDAVAEEEKTREKVRTVGTTDGTWDHPVEILDDDHDDDDVKMSDEVVDVDENKENVDGEMESSVIVDKASGSKGEMSPVKPRREMELDGV